jgi:hypothetical protein
MGFPKPLVVKSKKYMQWVKENDTCHCKYHRGEEFPTTRMTKEDHVNFYIFLNIFDFHHTEGRSRDDKGVKLCRWSHSLTESVAPSEWKGIMGFTQQELEEKAVILREEYLKMKNN